VEPDKAQELAQRDQLWASIRALRPHIDRLAAEGVGGSVVDAQLVTLLARIVAAELDFREHDTEPPV
jgi:hypothetical protein